MIINDKYELRGLDDKNIGLIEHGIAVKGKTEGEPTERVIAYFRDEVQALKYLARKEINGTGIKDVETVIAKVDELYKWIEKALEGK